MVVIATTSTSARKYLQYDPDEDNPPDPTQFTEHMSSARERTEVVSPSTAHDKTKCQCFTWLETRQSRHFM